MFGSVGLWGDRAACRFDSVCVCFCTRIHVALRCVAKCLSKISVCVCVMWSLMEVFMGDGGANMRVSLKAHFDWNSGLNEKG